MSRLDDIIEEGKRQGTKWQQSQLHFGGGVRDIWCKHIWTPLLYRGMNHIWPFYSTLCILSIHLLKTLLGPRTFSYVYLNRHLFSSSVVTQSCWYTLEACVSGIIVSSRRADLVVWVFSKLLISWDFHTVSRVHYWAPRWQSDIVWMLQPIGGPSLTSHIFLWYS